MKKKKDKVTLKEGEVDKPEVFQHFIGGIDPYHIEPIDNPQKPLGQETSRFSRTVMNSEIKPVYATIIKAMVLDQLRDIKRNYPEVLKQFLEDGK